MIQLFKLEKWTLLRGWLISSLIVFPFTFLPVFFKDGSLIEKLVLRIPESALYATGFSLLLVLAALYYNSENLRTKVELFQKPAFEKLGFSRSYSGYKSIVAEFNVYLSGYRNNIFYNIGIDIDFDDQNKKMVLINPNPDIPPYLHSTALIKEIQEVMKRDFSLTHDNDRLGIAINLDENKLDDPIYITRYLNLIESNLMKCKSLWSEG